MTPASSRNGPEERSFNFEPTAAVAASRSRSRYVDCPVCRADHSQYLFHKVGVRFVRCRSCGMVYANPVAERGTNYFDIEREPLVDDYERELAVRDFAEFLEVLERQFERAQGHGPKRVVSLGKFSQRFRDLPVARRIGFDYDAIDSDRFERLAAG